MGEGRRTESGVNPPPPLPGGEPGGEVRRNREFRGGSRKNHPLIFQPIVNPKS